MTLDDDWFTQGSGHVIHQEKGFFTFVEAREEMRRLREGSMRPTIPQPRLAASRANPHISLLPTDMIPSGPGARAAQPAFFGSWHKTARPSIRAKINPF